MRHLADPRSGAQVIAPHPQPAPRDLLWLALILALATGLRLWGLNAPLWYDEILTVTGHLRNGWGEMMSSYSMNYHYLHNLQAKLALQALGETPWAVRLPALVFGVSSIAAMWVLAWQVCGRMAAHMTALLLALSYHHIWFSQNARGYTELAFWGVVGMILFLRGLARPRADIWLAYGLTLMLATYTHLTGVFLYAAQGLIWLCWLATSAMQGKPLRDRFVWPALGYLAGGLLTILVYLPILPGMVATIGGVSETSAVDVMREYQSPIWTVLEGIRTALGAAGPLVAAVAVAVLTLSLIGALACRRAPLLGPVVLAHILLSVVLLLALNMRIWPRFFFTDILFLMLLIVIGVEVASGWISRLLGSGILARLVLPAAMVAMVLLSAGLATKNFLAPKQDLAGAVALVAAERAPGERVYAPGPAVEVFDGFFGTDWQALDSESEWLAASAEPGGFLVVVAFPDRIFRTLPDLDAATRDGRLELLRRFSGTLGDGDVLVFRRAAMG